MNWRQLRKLILRGPDPGRDPYRMDYFYHVAPTGQYQRAFIPWQRTRGGDAIALAPPYPYNNPIGAGIVFKEQASIFGPPPARYVFGALFFDYPTPGQPALENVQPGGPLYDPATVAALIGEPQMGFATTPTTPAIGARQAGQQRMGMSF